jgi:hypothetical protein
VRALFSSISAARRSTATVAHHTVQCIREPQRLPDRDDKYVNSHAEFLPLPELNVVCYEVHF